jgi:surfeit locus 1 family protein
MAITVTTEPEMRPEDVLDQPEPQSFRNRTLGTIAFVVLMLTLTGIFVALGIWQMNRLAEKEALIARVEERLGAPPQPLPPVAEWIGLDPELYDYRPVTVTGTFVHEATIRVFTSLSDARGQYAGPGYWIMTPMNLSGGGTVYINRGFVPEGLDEPFANGGSGDTGEVTLSGVARASESINAFTPGPDIAHRIEWVRDVERLAAFDPGEFVPLAGIYIDAATGEPGALPQGGETTVSFPNRHFEYAMTWFSFAVLTPALLGYWLWRQLARAPSTGSGAASGGTVRTRSKR